MPSRAAPRTSSQQRRHERTLFVHWLAAAVERSIPRSRIDAGEPASGDDGKVAA